MAETALLTLGRMPKALDLAWALAGAGWRVVIAEPFAWHLSRLSRRVARSYRVPSPVSDPAGYRAALRDVVARERVSLVVPVSEEIFHAAALDLPAGVRFFGEGQARLLALHDKLGFNRIAAGLGLPVPETFVLGTGEAAALAGAGPVVVKPALTCSGIGLVMPEPGEPLPEPAPEPARALIVQRRLGGRALTSFSVASRGRVLGTVIYRPLVLSGTVAVAFEPVEDAPLAVDWVERFVAGSGWSGFISFDFIEDAAGQPQAIECNPRATSGLHLVDPSDLATAILAPEAARPWRPRRPGYCKQFWPVLTEVWGAFGDPVRRAACWDALWRAREVNWSWRDPLPVATMPLTASQIMLKAATGGISFGEAATADIGWFEDPAAAAPPLPGQPAPPLPV